MQSEKRACDFQGTPYIGTMKERLHIKKNQSIPEPHSSQLEIRMDSAVAEVFDTYAPEARTKLLFLRQLIFDTAMSIDEVGNIEETLKWGEPSYLTPVTQSGSTVRLGWKSSAPNKVAVYFKCTANLVPAIREKYANLFNLGGNRSIEFELNDTVPVRELKNCIALALTYHLNKKLTPSARWKMAEAWSL